MPARVRCEPMLYARFNLTLNRFLRRLRLAVGRVWTSWKPVWKKWSDMLRLSALTKQLFISNRGLKTSWIRTTRLM
ncbi:hypothetical protein HMPREF2692_11575 [Corynebacterium sp. HMSC036D03]|nr:hypothetical protein HMPREF2935_00770 [Corynebacterium sp. HMSC076D02]OFR37939.1 hypothetical protein HMPREF2888_01930 [Corynebacterium sp. HMSC077D03]OHO70633.1 hypothetical protein HMPREF2692_11575 [Corynebacterium sp. HMSC036D03]